MVSSTTSVLRGGLDPALRCREHPLLVLSPRVMTESFLQGCARCQITDQQAWSPFGADAEMLAGETP